MKFPVCFHVAYGPHLFPTALARRSTLRRLLLRTAVAGGMGSARVQTMIMKPTGALTALEDGIDNIRDVDS